VSKQLNFFEELLDNKQFFRAHLSYLVNKNYVKGIETQPSLRIELENKITIPLARRRKVDFLKFLKVE